MVGLAGCPLTPFASPATALVRGVSAFYSRCVRVDGSLPIRVERALRQHDAYVAALRDAGIPVRFVPTADDLPDACFVEDTAVITSSELALLTMPGAASRRKEIVQVGPVLSQYCALTAMGGAARLDGGDVLRVGETLFIGVSARTNPEGAGSLAAFAQLQGLSARRVPVSAGLHLKSACTLVDSRTLIYAPSLLNSEALAILGASGCEMVACPEPAGANVLAFDDRVLVSAAAPRTAELLHARGKRPVVLELGEFHVGDGALTCLSLRVPRAGTWCA